MLGALLTRLSEELVVGSVMVAACWGLFQHGPGTRAVFLVAGIYLFIQLLDWVRDNRATFVRWGMVVARAIRFVVKVIRGFVRLLQSIGKNLLRWMGMDSLEEFINILQFKIAVIAIGIKLMAQAVGAFIKGIWEQVGDDASSFLRNIWDTIKMVGEDILGWLDQYIQGFTDTFDLGGNLENILDIWNRVLSVFKELWEALFGGEKGDKWGEFFKGWGALTGAGINAMVAAFSALYRVLTNFVRDVIATEGFQKLADFLANVAQSVGKILALGVEPLKELTAWFNSIGGRDEERAVPGENIVDFVQGTATPLGGTGVTNNNGGNTQNNVFNLNGNAQEQAEEVGSILAQQQNEDALREAVQ